MFFLIKKFVFAFILLILGCYVSSISAFVHHNDVVESVEPEIEKRALPALRWEGVCPAKAATCPTSFIGKPPVILVSLDGFRPDYMTRGYTPTTKNIGECGTNAPFMYPVFPSKTYPNHYSQVTGLNPASHGIIDNNIYDVPTGRLFKLGNKESLQSFWWEKEPIWVTARKQGKITATYYWPGSEVVINGSTPTYFKKWNPKATFEDRVDQVLAWLDLPQASRPHFITLYSNQPDNAGHYYGTKSKQVNDALAKVDRMITRLFTGLQQRNLVNCVNVVIVSDHGMADTDCKRVVDVRNYVNVSQISLSGGPYGRIRPKGRKNATLVNDLLSKLKCSNPRMRAYPKEHLPVRMHFSDHQRIEPIFLELDSGWTVVSKDTSGNYSGICSGAAHGYDNLFPEMRSIFIAHGPSFKKNYTTRPFINTELYEMLAELISIKPQPNNGTRGSLHHIMTRPRTLDPQVEPDPPALGEIPANDLEYKYRLMACNCSCSQIDKREQTQENDVQGIRSLHLPFGIPFSFEDNSTMRLLYNKDYVGAFDLKYRIPMWSAFTIKRGANITKADDLCWKGDARIPTNDAPNCGDYQKAAVKRNYILQRPLYSPGFSNASRKNDASYITNSIPKSMNFTKILEKPINQILAKWAAESGELNVVTGPAFDLSATGVRPSKGRLMRLQDKSAPLTAPTHIFFVATWCKVRKSALKDCNPSKLEVQAFLLPNQPYVNNCEPASTVISRNVARVVDVEKLTGVTFYTGLPVYDAIRLRTILPERQILMN